MLQVQGVPQDDNVYGDLGERGFSAIYIGRIYGKCDQDVILVSSAGSHRNLRLHNLPLHCHLPIAQTTLPLTAESHL